MSVSGEERSVCARYPTMDAVNPDFILNDDTDDDDDDDYDDDVNSAAAGYVTYYVSTAFLFQSSVVTGLFRLSVIMPPPP